MGSSRESDSQWFIENGLPWWAKVPQFILQLRGVPNHVAFIMDGNRRHARRNRMKSVIEGHVKGFDQMIKILDWSYKMGIKEVTLYAFSIDNFKRDPSEVDGLMKLAEQKFLELLQNKHKLEKHGLRFQFFGERNLLSTRIRELIARIEYETCNHTRGILNFCISYTSQNEIARAMEWIRLGVQAGHITEKDVNAQLIADCLDTRHCSPVDMLIRTSGEHRISDFLLWQCANCYVHFEDVLWPELNFWHLCTAIFSYQQSRAFGEKLNKTLNRPTAARSDCVAKFLEWMETERKKSGTELLSRSESLDS